MDETVKPAEAAPAPVEAPPPARSVGERLRAGRERAGLSIPAAAEKLHLDNRVIEALEADRFAEVGASVYVRGHLKRYGDFVGENGLELVSMYTTRETRQAPPDLTQVPHPERRADPRRLLTPLVVLGSCAALLVAVWWVLSGSKPAARPVAAVTPTAVVTGNASSEENLPARVTAEPASLTSSTPMPASTPVKPADPAAGTTRREGAPVRETLLQLELTSESWVEVYDSSGGKLFYDIASAGSVQRVSGRGPLRVFLGNPAGVSVQVDGQRRDIPAGAIDEEGARFVVNRSGSLAPRARQ